LVFFGARLIGAALAEIALLLAAILATTVLFWRIDRVAGARFRSVRRVGRLRHGAECGAVAAELDLDVDPPSGPCLCLLAWKPQTRKYSAQTSSKRFQSIDRNNSRLHASERGRGATPVDLYSL
jgi:hypothetical protein